MAEEDTRTRILYAAGEAFAERGFEATTVRQICQKAGVNLASINYHFGDKERLYSETLRFAHQLKTEQFLLPEWSPDTPPETKLRDFVRTILARMLAAHSLPWQDQLLMREMLRPSGSCRDLIRESIRPQFDQLLAILDELLLPEKAPPAKRFQLGFSIIGQCLFYRFHQPVIEMLVPKADLDLHFHREQLAEHISNVVLAAVGREKLLLSMGEPNSSSESNQ